MVTLRQVEPDDYELLAETLPAGFPNTTREIWLQRFENWWTLNPAITSEFPRGWVLEERGNISGFIGNIPVKYVIRGETITAAASASWYVEPSLRGIASIRLFREYLSQSNVDLFLFYNNKKDLLKAVFKQGFREYPAHPHPMEYLFIIDRRHVIHKKSLIYLLRNYFLPEKADNANALPELLKKLGSFTYSYILEMSSKKIRNSPAGPYTSSLCTECDESFTRLWDPIMESFDVALSRDTPTLNWLYFIAGRRYDRKVIQCRKSTDNALAGYMVFDYLPWNASGGGAMQLVDMCVPTNDRQVLASLISRAIDVGRQNNAPILLLWSNNPDLDESLRMRSAVKWPAGIYSLFKFSRTLEKESSEFTVNSCRINPPRGIDH